MHILNKSNINSEKMIINRIFVSTPHTRTYQKNCMRGVLLAASTPRHLPQLESCLFLLNCGSCRLQKPGEFLSLVWASVFLICKIQTEKTYVGRSREDSTRQCMRGACEWHTGLGKPQPFWQELGAVESQNYDCHLWANCKVPGLGTGPGKGAEKPNSCPTAQLFSPWPGQCLGCR